ncbi:MAG: peptidylprolyl isomerase [Opitutaceae bacterium]
MMVRLGQAIRQRRAVFIALLALASGFRLHGQTPPPDDGLNLRFADGIVAIVDDKVITVDDVRHEIEPYLAQLQANAKSEEDFNHQLQKLQDQVIQQLIDRVLIIEDFRKDDKKHIPASFVDEQIADNLVNQFGNDRSKFLAYLRDKGETMKDYRKEVEDDIIYDYETHQQRKSDDIVSPVRIEQYYRENKDQFYQDDQVYMRMIQLSPVDGATPAELLAQANSILVRFHNGESFADLAREYSQDAHRGKGGDWGWKKRTDLLPEFGDPLFALKKGEATQPLVTKDGVFILYCQDRRYAGIQPLNQVRGQIENILLTQMTQQSTEQWLERLRRNGYIKHF